MFITLFGFEDILSYVFIQCIYLYVSKSSQKRLREGEKILCSLNSCHGAASWARTDFNASEHPQGTSDSSITSFTPRNT